MSKAFNIPVMVNKVFIIVGIGCGGSKGNTTKHIMIGLVFHALRMSLMGMGSGIWMNTEAHVWIWIKLRFGLAGERFPRESQSCMTDLRRIGWRLLAFLCAGFGDGCVNLRID